jgi:hypothetical protein
MTKTSLPTAANDDERAWSAVHWDAFYRSASDFWKFWDICSEKPCNRARACRGDVHRCRAKHLPVVSTEGKIWLHTVLLARFAGMSVAQACAQGDEVLRSMGITDDLPAVHIPAT